jgi:hypothetical protein
MTDSIREMTVTEEHLALLRRAVVCWEDCEYGAPAIDCKRPYGNSSVEYDIAEILNWPDEDGDMSRETRERAAKIHAETEHVLQIILTTGEMRTGRYVRSTDYRRDWRRAE